MLLISLFHLAGLVFVASAEASYDVSPWAGSPLYDSPTEYWNVLHKRVDGGKLEQFEAPGRALDCLMQNTQAGAQKYAASNPWLTGKPLVSQYTDPQALTTARWGYAEFKESDREGAMDTVNDALSALKLTNTDSFQAVAQTWTSTTQVATRRGTLVYLKANYANIFDVTDGALIATDNNSPTANAILGGIDLAANPNLLPQPNVWSDVVFLQYQLMATGNEAPVAALKHVFRTGILNDDTAAAITEALGTREQPQSWAERITFTPTAPGADETPDNKAFYGLLYTPNVRGVAWWLVQHKAQMGLKYIDSISVWFDVFPALYIHIADWTPPATS